MLPRVGMKISFLNRIFEVSVAFIVKELVLGWVLKITFATISAKSLKNFHFFIFPETFLQILLQNSLRIFLMFPFISNLF